MAGRLRRNQKRNRPKDGQQRPAVSLKPATHLQICYRLRSLTNSYNSSFPEEKPLNSQSKLRELHLVQHKNKKQKQ